MVLTIRSMRTLNKTPQPGPNEQMKLWKFSAALLIVLTTGAACFAGELLPSETALDRYVAQPDENYTWKVVGEKSEDGLTSYVIDMASQKWRTRKDVNQPIWRHWLVVARPDEVVSETGFLFIGGGHNGGRAPDGATDVIRQIAQATKTVVAELRMVPNQSLVFHNDGQGRVEDDLIGYTWDQFLKTGDANWPARNPMVKSAVRAMDTMTAFAAGEQGGKLTVDKFVVAGGSKRGWTTWLTGAVDKRVAAIIPIVIDVLNVDISMRHHHAAYGFWAPAVGNYVQHKIMERLNHPRMKALYELVDPYYYRHRLTMPKFIVNAAGDEFFLPDSSRFYFDDLEGEKHLRYVPNANHSLNGSDAIESIVAFYSMILLGANRPQYSWSMESDGSIRVESEQAPRQVKLWQATNPDARDFRLETLGAKYTSTPLEPAGNGLYVGNVDAPEKGWTAFFVELTYDIGATVPAKFTTAVRVVPDTLPFADKDPTAPVGKQR